MVNASQARAMFLYNPETGELTRKVGIPGHSAGSRVGSLRTDGYRAVEIDGKSYCEHRLIWLMTFGKRPRLHIDHVNGNRSDNRASNLREASVAENAQNRIVRSDNKIGLKGVRKQGNSWLAAASIAGTSFHLGSFRTKEEAYAAYRNAKAKIHKFEPSVRE